MPILKSAPTPTQFATMWAKEFETALKAAAGKDGKLSITEAKRLAERTDGKQVFSDSAVKILKDAYGAKTTSVSKLVLSGQALAEAAAKVAAGKDGKLSLTDGGKLPTDLREDFLFLRGKGTVVVQPQYTDAELKAVVKAEVLKAITAGTATKLPAPPTSVKGRRPVVDDIPLPASNTRAIAYVANNIIYISRASPVPSPLVGWYEIGKLPPK